MDVIPSQTIYINNIFEKIKQEELKKSLYELFSKFGPIMDVVAMKTLKMKGQAFVVFKDIAAAGNALREMQGFMFYGKPIRINYAKAKSDAVAKLDGSYEPRIKEVTKKKDGKKRSTSNSGPAAKKSRVDDKTPIDPSTKGSSSSSSSSSGSKAVAPRNAPPNNILFVENLPDEITNAMVSALFGQFPGLREVRLVPSRKGIAFIEYENVQQATTAMENLQYFKITPNDLMVISFAKR